MVERIGRRPFRSSPPITHNFHHEPIVTHGPYDIAEPVALAADGKARGRLLDGGPATVAGGAQPGGSS